MKQNFINLMYRDGDTGTTDAALINTAGQIGGAAINAIASSNLNKKTMQFSKDMYAMQRTDALADWQRQTDYNSPTSQMNRLKAANLNPNLVYGNGNAQPTAPSVRSSEAPAWNPHTPDYGSISVAAGNSMANYYDARIKQATIDNLKAQNTATVQKAALDSAMTANSMASTDKIKVDTDMTRSLKDTSLSIAEQNLRKLTVGTDIDLQKNEREAATNASGLREAAGRILNLRLEGLQKQAQTDETRKRIDEINSRIKQIDTDTRIKNLDENLKAQGIQPSDNLFNRLLQKLLNETHFAPGGSLLSGAKEFSRKVDSTVTNPDEFKKMYKNK